MKKFILIAIALLVGLSATAQEHIKFKGIEVAGDIKNFVTQYKAKCPNAKELYKDDAFRVFAFQDTFCGIDGMVLVHFTKSGVVYEVLFSSEEVNNWNSLVCEYDKIFEPIKIKYGEPTANSREFKYPYNQKEFEDLKASAVKAGKCEYSASWLLAEGTISLLISGNLTVGIFYTDKLGSETNVAENNAQYQDEV